MGAREQNDINIDDFVDYRSEYWAFIKKPKISGDNLTGLCPFHADSNSSFSVDLKTGKWHCFAEDIGGNFVSFWARIYGCDEKEAYKQILEKYDRAEDAGKPSPEHRSYSLKQYSFEKKLPEDWLQTECRMETARKKDGTTFLKIPYFDERGVEITHRERFAKKDFRWKYGTKRTGVSLYGEWRLAACRKAGYVILVEGESDTQSLWYMGLSALGVPGASTFKPAHVEYLRGMKLYIHQEQDVGGTTFIQKVTDGLREAGFEEEVYKFSCGAVEGCKDPSDVFLQLGRDDGRDRIMELVKAAGRVDLTKAEVVSEALQGAPVNLRQPEGWAFNEDGVFKLDAKTLQPALVCRTPVIITKRLLALESESEQVQVSFKRDGAWKSAVFQRSTIFSARSITCLADIGCTISSENAKQMVRFLAALEAENFELIPRVESASVFGWQPGNRFIPGREKGIEMAFDPWQMHMAAGYTQKGTLEDWIAMVARFRSKMQFRCVLAASFAAPLLRYTGQRVFLVHNWSSAGGGKTACLKAALSAWGDPAKTMLTFNMTGVAMERAAALYRDLPFGIDERQLAGKNQEFIETTVYMLASGTGRGRGEKTGGMQEVKTWRSVILTTGEEPLYKDHTQGGVLSRMIDLYGEPFDDQWEASGMHQQTSDNFGVAGPEFIDRILKLPDGCIKEKHKELSAWIMENVEDAVGSHVSAVALIALADALIDGWFFSGAVSLTINIENLDSIPKASWDAAKAMALEIMRGQKSKNAEEGDVNQNAVQYLAAWVMSNAASFTDMDGRPQYGEMTSGGETVYILAPILRDALEREGYSSTKTLRYMAEKQLISVSVRKDNAQKSGQRKSYSIVRRFKGPPMRMVEFFIGKVTDPEKWETLPDARDAAFAEAVEKSEKEEFAEVPTDIKLPFD